jgi:hypothetical protein
MTVKFRIIHICHAQSDNDDKTVPICPGGYLLHLPLLAHNVTPMFWPVLGLHQENNSFTRRVTDSVHAHSEQ